MTPRVDKSGDINYFLSRDGKQYCVKLHEIITPFTHEPEEDDEVWFKIPPFPDYELSSNQRVRSLKKIRGQIRRKVMKPFTTIHGYIHYCLRRGAEKHTLRLHQIVTSVIYGPVPDNMEVRHYDDNKENNFASNLLYGTKTENRDDARRNGKLAALAGVANGSAVVDDDKVRDIRRFVESGGTRAAAGKIFGISSVQAGNIASRKAWKHVI